jgi:NADH dehydrogenase/NADH:ubiquinone oxidoreductase subunit G
MEEGYLARAIAQRLGSGPCVIVSPPTSSIADDGKLISSDRYANRAGLRALGLTEQLSPPAAVDGALLVRGDVVSHDEAAWGSFLERCKQTVVVVDAVGKSMAYADAVIAVGSHFEAPGSFLNRTGRLQVFGPAVEPPGRALAGWEALAGLLTALGGPKYQSVDEIFRAMCLDLGLGAGRSHASVGAGGTPLSSWKDGCAAARGSAGASAQL